MADVAKTWMLIPSKKFAPTVLPFGVVAGEGVDNYKKTAKEYTVTIKLDKKMVKEIKEFVLDFWNENKGKSKRKEPANFASMFKKNKAGETVMYVKSNTTYKSGDPVEIPIVNGKRIPLDPEKFGKFGGETTGRVNVGFAIYGEGKPEGVSRYIQAIQLTHFEKGGADKTVAFEDEDGDIETGGEGFSEEESKPKKKKKKKK